MNTIVDFARVVIETESPLSVGSGKADQDQDVVILRDIHGLPTISGAALAGVLRAACRRAGDTVAEALFGKARAKQEDNAGREREKSSLFVGWAHAHGADDNPRGGQAGVDIADDEVVKFLRGGGVKREHVKITEKGVAEAEKKFDRTAVPRGARFTFDLWLERDVDVAAGALARIADRLAAPIEIGGATRRGYGSIRLVRASQALLDLKSAQGRAALLALRDPIGALPSGVEWTNLACARSARGGAERIDLRLRAEDFWRTGAGEVVESVDGKDVRAAATAAEPFIEWPKAGAGGRAAIKKAMMMPASGIKGPLRHRTLFHLHRIRSRDGGAAPTDDSLAGLFGTARDGAEGRAGRLHISDGRVFDNGVEDVIRHNSIDRFTGGVRRGILFFEKAVWRPAIEFAIHVEPGVDTELREAFELALADLREGRLALGAASAKGHGYFRAEAGA